MSKKTKSSEPSDAVPIADRTVNGFIAENHEKWNRAIFGAIGSLGTLTGGVGENASLEAKLAAYDKLGGLITKGGRKIKTGSFYDFAGKKARATPEVSYIFRDLEGEEVVVPEGEEVPLEVRAAEIATANKANKVSAKKAAKDTAKVGVGSKKKPNIEDEE